MANYGQSGPIENAHHMTLTFEIPQSVIGDAKTIYNTKSDNTADKKLRERWATLIVRDWEYLRNLAENS